MGHKIFVSYKYADNDVKSLSTSFYQTDTVRTYVDKLSEYISASDHIYKGENDGEDLSSLSEDTIWSKLRDRIYDSTLTIVMISPGMRESYLSDKDQWIPWEVSYSLKETSRKNINGDSITSRSNAMLAIVVPDRNGSYSYYTYNKTCCDSGCRVLNTNRLFNILRSNMFNIKAPDKRTCGQNSIIYSGESSYILSVTWDDFISSPENYIQRAYDIQEIIDSYNIVKDI